MITRFEWDPSKNAANQRKQNIRFEDAAAVFSDPLHLSTLDGVEGGEDRWKTFGYVDGFALILVVHTYRDSENVEVIRLISSRRATRQERKQHERQND